MINVNGEPLKVTLFPDKTSQVWKVPKIVPTLSLSIVWNFESEAEFMHLAQLKDLYDHLGGEYSCLLITQLPYARQDKPISNETTFALHTFAALLNSLKFDNVIICDPHSRVALKLIDKATAFYPTAAVGRISNEFDLFCYPDTGAYRKYAEMYAKPYIYAEKTRDQSTGAITGLSVKGPCKDKNVLIVDDICDGGGTFVLLAAKLLEEGANSVSLFVTHGIFSKGTKVLYDAGITRIFTKNGELK